MQILVADDNEKNVKLFQLILEVCKNNPATGINKIVKCFKMISNRFFSRKAGEKNHPFHSHTPLKKRAKNFHL